MAKALAQMTASIWDPEGKVDRGLKRLTPALCTLAHPGLEADEFLLALGCRADQHQHAFGGLFHPGLQVDPVGPHVHVSPRFADGAAPAAPSTAMGGRPFSPSSIKAMIEA
jgi:hypothetical protein